MARKNDKGKNTATIEEQPKAKNPPKRRHRSPKPVPHRKGAAAVEPQSTVSKIETPVDTNVTKDNDKEEKLKRKSTAKNTVNKKSSANSKTEVNSDANSVVELKFVLVGDEEQLARQQSSVTNVETNVETVEKKSATKEKKAKVAEKTVETKTKNSSSPKTQNKEKKPVAKATVEKDDDITTSETADTTVVKAPTDKVAPAAVESQNNTPEKDNKILNIPKINFFLPEDKKQEKSNTSTEKQNNNSKTPDTTASSNTPASTNVVPTTVQENNNAQQLDKSNPFIEDSPVIPNDNNLPKTSFTWVQYSSDKITRTYFIPLLGLAHRFYPRLYYCENRVKLVTFINGQEVVYEENSISDKRTDFDFLSVLLQWRVQYMKSSLNLEEKQVDAWISLEDDLIALHNLIRIRYTDSNIKDLVQFVSESNKIVNAQLSNHREFIFTNVHGYTQVEISKLYIKYEIEFKFKNADRKFQKHINVILE